MALTPGEMMGQLIDGSVKYARSAERLRATIASLSPVSEALTSLAELDPELQPELKAAAGYLDEVLAALTRAFDYQNARYEVLIEQIGDAAAEADSSP